MWYRWTNPLNCQLQCFTCFSLYKYSICFILISLSLNWLEFSKLFLPEWGFESFSLSYVKEQTVCSLGLIFKCLTTKLPASRAVCKKFYQKRKNACQRIFLPETKKVLIITTTEQCRLWMTVSSWLFVLNFIAVASISRLGCRNIAVF